VNYLIALTIGALAGVHVSTWGMYKDAPHEGFTWRKYLRSPIVGAFLGVAVYPFVDWRLTDPSAAFLFWGLIYVLERATTEFWKGFVREEDQSKYFIPMQFGVLGKPINDFGTRMAAGLLYAAVVIGVFVAVLALDRAQLGWPTWLVVLTIGSVGGWVSACGGAWKDAPIEGFETLKFFRSPIITILWSGVIAHFTHSFLVIALSSFGLTIATIETYKTFLFPARPRGKFSGKPVTHPEMLHRRRRFVPVYVAVWISVIAMLGLALSRPHLPFIV